MVDHGPDEDRALRTIGEVAGFGRARPSAGECAASGRAIELAIDNSILHSREAARTGGLISRLRSVDTVTGTVRTLATAAKGTIFTGLARSPGGGKVAITRSPWTGGRAALQIAPMGGAPNRTVVRARRPRRAI